jgi:enamine deaminase RidA (YjgF/YER057c/UK114 family)
MLVRRGAPRSAGARRDPVLPPPPAPTAQYVAAVASGRLLFVSGHDPEVGGRLRYRGRVGRGVSLPAARAAVRLAAANALAAARATVGNGRRLGRCVALTCFVDATPDVIGTLSGGGRSAMALVGSALALIRRVLGPAPPVVWLRPATGLAGGMPVEVELTLEVIGP